MQKELTCEQNEMQIVEHVTCWRLLILPKGQNPNRTKLHVMQSAYPCRCPARKRNTLSVKCARKQSAKSKESIPKSENSGDYNVLQLLLQWYIGLGVLFFLASSPPPAANCTLLFCRTLAVTVPHSLESGHTKEVALCEGAFLRIHAEARGSDRVPDLKSTKNGDF